MKTKKLANFQICISVPLSKEARASHVRTSQKIKSVLMLNIQNIISYEDEDLQVFKSAQVYL